MTISFCVMHKIPGKLKMNTLFKYNYKIVKISNQFSKKIKRIKVSKNCSLLKHKLLNAFIFLNNPSSNKKNPQDFMLLK